MISASEARMRLDKNNQQEEREEIERLIQKALKYDVDYCDFDGQISVAMENELKALGYKVIRVDNFRDGSYTRIKW